MNTHGIDDLLAKVSLDLVEKYEKINLPPGPTLRVVNEEYKGMRNPSTFVLRVALAVFVLMLIGIDGSIVLMLCGKQVPVCLTPTLPAIALMVIVFLPLKKRTEKDLERLQFLTSILEQFRGCVEILDYLTSHVAVDKYTIESIREMFVRHAMKILDCKAAYDKLRVIESSPLRDVLLFGNSLNSLQEEFHAVSGAVEKSFGLKFSNDDIFAEAKRHL